MAYICANLKSTCKKNPTLEKRASLEIDGFEDFCTKIRKHVAIIGRSDSLRESYIRSLSKLALHFNRHPLEISPAEVNDYLFHVKQTIPSASEACFKFIVYSLRFVYKMEGIKSRSVLLPSMKTVRKLPVVLSRNEVKSLLYCAKSPKHKCLLLVLYGCGLRSSEVRNLMVSDIDFDRQNLLVRMGKGGKDRYVPLCDSLVGHLKAFIKSQKIIGALFRGSFSTRKNYSPKGVQWVVNSCAKKAGILKKITVHTLRHTYATHLLESGLDIVSIKELLGHGRIETTMVYLHVARCERISVFSPLETLYGELAAPEQAYRSTIRMMKSLLEKFN